ncbi:MAG: hypothetical protein FWG55_03630 [Candidatus Bathyarchaeota archaeon]|nr:hypothetical protein [Candidatus Termiticorpusculum sp.]
MNKIKILLTVLSILITVTPIATQVLIHRDNLLGLVIPATINDLLNASVDGIDTADDVELAGISFPLPALSDEPVFFQNNTVKLMYTFTNPLNNEITVTAMDAEIVCTDHGFLIGNASIEPTTLEPKQTLDIPVTCLLSPQALEHIKTSHQGQDSIKAEFKNFSVELSGVTIHMDHRKLGYIQAPMLPIALNHLLR